MDIYTEILAALETEPHVMLATIISTSGSTPAAALSKMLVVQNGIASVGTVGGGCMEGEVLLHANRLYPAQKAEILTFHLNEDDVEHGLICGGSLEVLVEPVDKAQVPLIQKLRSARDEGIDQVIATVIQTDGLVRAKEVLPSGDVTAVKKLAVIVSRQESEIAETIARAHKRQETQVLSISGGKLLVEPLPGAPRLIIFGGGHVSKYVARIASMAGFRITVVDDREKFANRKRFPEAAETIVLEFSEAFKQIKVTSSTFLLIVTRGHEYDEMLLGAALKTPARYIGMIGSKRKVLRAFERLKNEGTPVEALRRVYAPVGVDIGAVTAEEIAVSIASQIIALRRKGSSIIQHKSESIKENFTLMEKKGLIAASGD